MAVTLILTVGLPLAAVLILILCEPSQPTQPAKRPSMDRRNAAVRSRMLVTFKGRP